MPMSVGELCLRLGGSRFHVYKQLFDGFNQGLIAADRITAEAGASGDRHGTSNMLLDNARLLISERQFDEAREVVSTALNLDPDNLEARTLIRDLRRAQLEHLYQQFPPHKVPVRAVAQKRLDRYGLTPRETYLLSRLDGRWDVGSLVVATPLGELETLRILGKFFHAGIVKFKR